MSLLPPGFWASKYWTANYWQTTFYRYWPTWGDSTRYREKINLFSYIKKVATSCSNIIRSDDIDSNIVKTYSSNSFLKKVISITSSIDRELIT